MSNHVPLDSRQLAAFCKKWKLTEFAVFGSVLRDDFSDDSDVDVLVTFAPDAKRGLFRLVEMKDELESIFGRKVDLLTRGGVEGSSNRLRREAILSTAEVLYAA